MIPCGIIKAKKFVVNNNIKANKVPEKPKDILTVKNTSNKATTCADWLTKKKRHQNDSASFFIKS